MNVVKNAQFEDTALRIEKENGTYTLVIQGPDFRTVVCETHSRAVAVSKFKLIWRFSMG